MRVTCPTCSTEHTVEDGIQSVACDCGTTLVVRREAEGGAAAPRESVPAGAGSRRHTAARGGGGGGLLDVILQGPASGPQRSLWAGLLLILLTFSVKQGIISWAYFNTGSALQQPKLELQRQALLAGLDWREDENKIEKIREGDALGSWLVGRFGESPGPLDRWLSGDDVYADRMDDAEGTTVRGGAKAITKLQWFFYTKLFLDMGKLLGVFLVVFGAMQIVSDNHQSSSEKQFATVCAGAVLMSTLFGGLLALLG